MTALIHSHRAEHNFAERIAQVFDLQDEECRPAKVLRKLWDNLDAAIAAGDGKSAYFKQNLRVIAAGGDGTVAWILGTIRQARLKP